MGSDLLIKQANALTESRHDLSDLEKAIFYALLQEIDKGEAYSVGKRTANKGAKYYEISLSPLKKMIKTSLTIERLLDASRRLLARTYTIKKEHGGELYTALVSYITNMPDDKLIIGVPGAIHPYLIELKQNYTQFGLETALNLKGKYAKRLYEMLSQHKDVEVFYISIEDLKWRLSIFDPKSKKDKYPSFSSFKKVVITSSQKEINEKSDLMFTYEAHKEGKGKKYTHLTFNIRPRARQISLL